MNFAASPDIEFQKIKCKKRTVHNGWNIFDLPERSEDDSFHVLDLATTKGYGYRMFFPISKQENDGLKLKFNVKAHSDGHILLSPEQYPKDESPVYEIVLGAGENTYSVIRRKKRCENKVITNCKQFLVSPDEWREFWIEMKGNKIQVRRKDSGAFMEWEDPEPLPIKYYGFCCWNDAPASWIVLPSQPSPPSFWADLDVSRSTHRTTGYGYHIFSPISKQENDGLKLKFNVIAPKDGYILLSPQQFPKDESPVYEIVLGAGENTYSVIRRKKLGENKVVTYSAESLVSPDEWREFWIEMKGNKIQVGRKDSGAFMEWEDPEPLPIKYYSFSCYDNAIASWIIMPILF
ncbi:uncharacterized protein LOC135833320 [Planococcus citri]|uniref:uncharacterized protein LOC135833320 n=1 Tax=Planococcus citri TaxID=170843 RepID=UPI0031F8A96D